MGNPAQTWGDQSGCDSDAWVWGPNTVPLRVGIGGFITVVELLLGTGSEDLNVTEFSTLLQVWFSQSQTEESGDQIASCSLVFNKQLVLCGVDCCQERRDLMLCADMIRDSQPQKKDYF